MFTVVMFVFAFQTFPAQPFEFYNHMQSAYAELVDQVYVEKAQNILDILLSYETASARNQFYTLRREIWEPGLTVLENDIINRALPEIESLQLAQKFKINKSSTKVIHDSSMGNVLVQISGTISKYKQNKFIAEEQITYELTMSTVPPNKIVVSRFKRLN